MQKRELLKIFWIWNILLRKSFFIKLTYNFIKHYSLTVGFKRSKFTGWNTYCFLASNLHDNTLISSSYLSNRAIDSSIDEALHCENGSQVVIKKNIENTFKGNIIIMLLFWVETNYVVLYVKVEFIFYSSHHFNSFGD